MAAFLYALNAFPCADCTMNMKNDAAPLHEPGNERRPMRSLTCLWALLLFFGFAGAHPVHAADVAQAEQSSSGKAPLDSIEQRVKPCTACHGNEGRATREGYFPRIAGKPAGYLFNQLLNFRAGRRHFPMMTYMAQLQTDAYLRELADYFGALRVPYAPPHSPSAAATVLERGRQLVMEGDKTLNVPACNSCHGRRLLGVSPAVPGLLGVSQDYLTAQLGAWREGVRAAAAPDCMGELVRRMRADDLNAATTWLASRVVPEPADPDTSFDRPPPLECGSILQESHSP
jgi:cytochrome c553